MKEINVLLLAMSTLGKDFINTYEYNGKENGYNTWYFKGISQLEPDSKLVLSLLDRQNKKIDRIVILASKEAREEKKIVNGKSSVEFYMERMNGFSKNSDPYEERIDDVQELENQFKDVKYHTLQNKYTEDIEFKEIYSERNDYLLQAVQAIEMNEEKTVEDKKINLYISIGG